MTAAYFMMATLHMGLLMGLTVAFKPSLKLFLLILVGGLLWPGLMAGFLYLKWSDRP